MSDPLLIGTIWTELPGVAISGGDTVSASLGVSNILTATPSDFARFLDIAPEKTFLEIDLGQARSVRQLGVIGNLRQGDSVRLRMSNSPVAAPSAVPPDALVSQDNLTGSLASITDNPDAFDADSTWLTATVDNLDGLLSVNFPGRSGLLTGPASQELRFSIRGSAIGEFDTALVIQVRQGASLISATASSQSLDADGAPKVISVTFDAADLLAPSSDFQLRIATATNGIEGTGPAMEIGALRWYATFTFIDHDSGYIPAPVAEESSLWSGSRAAESDHSLIYYDAGANVADVRYVRLDFRRGRSADLLEVGNFLVASGYTPSVQNNVNPTGQLSGVDGLQRPTVTPGGQSAFGSVQEPRKTLNIDLRLVPEAEAKELYWRVVARGPARFLVSTKPSAPTDYNTMYGEVQASGKTAFLTKAGKPDHFNVSFVLAEKR